ALDLRRRLHRQRALCGGTVAHRGLELDGDRLAARRRDAGLGRALHTFLRKAPPLSVSADDRKTTENGKHTAIAEEQKYVSGVYDALDAERELDERRLAESLRMADGEPQAQAE